MSSASLAGGDPDPDQTVSARRRRAIAILALTLMIGWGTTLYVPPVLAPLLARDLGIASEMVYGGISLMLLAGAFAAPQVGVAHDRFGACRMMAAGSLVMSVGLTILALAQGPVAYVVCWLLLGLAMPMCLANGAFSAIAQMDAVGARRIITIMSFFTGVTSTIFWPLIDALQQAMGWRATIGLFALTHLCLCLPLHLIFLPRRQGAHAAAPDADDAIENGTLADERRLRSQWLLMLVFSAQGFVSWGYSVHIIDMVKSVGVPASLAVMIASLKGPCGVSARICDMLLGARYPAAYTGLFAIALLVLATILLLVSDAQPIALAAAFAIAYGISDGLMSLAKPAIPLSLYGRRDYGAIMGRLTRPQNLVAAAAPVAYAAMMTRIGTEMTLYISLFVSLIAVGGMAALLSYIRRAP